MKKPSAKARGKAPRPKPYEDNKVDFSKFKTKFSPIDIARLTSAGAGHKALARHLDRPAQSRQDRRTRSDWRKPSKHVDSLDQFQDPLR